MEPFALGVLAVLLIVVLIQLANGKLGAWLRAKFLSKKA